MPFAGDSASVYERLFVAAHESWAAIAAACAFADGGAGVHILDVGSGPGEPACHLKHAFPHAEVTSTDKEADMVDKAKARAEGLGRRLHFNVCSAEDLTVFPNASFDVVTANFVLMFVPDKRRMLEEAMRVLKPGGRLILTVWKVFTLMELAYEMAEETLPTAGSFPLSLRAPGAVEALVEEAGLRLVASEHCMLTMSWESDVQMDQENFLFFVRRVLGGLPEAERASRAENYLRGMAEETAKRGLKVDGAYQFPGEYQLAVIARPHLQ